MRAPKLSFLVIVPWILTACPPDTTVVDANRPPVAEDDEAEVSAGATVEIDVRENDSDPDGDLLRVESVTQPSSGGEATVTDDNRDVEFTASEDAEGVVEFEYTLTDGQGGTDMATVEVTVAAIPTLVILTPSEGEVLEVGPVGVTWELTGCDVSGPSSNAAGCHLHRYLDDEGYEDLDTGTGWYARAPFDLLSAESGDLAEGEHTLALRIHKNDGTDGAWEPEIVETVTFCVGACSPE